MHWIDNQSVPCICLEPGATDLADATATPSYRACFIKIQNPLKSFLVPAYPGCTEEEAVKRVLVYMCLSCIVFEIWSHLSTVANFSYPTYIWRPVRSDANGISPRFLALENYSP